MGKNDKKVSSPKMKEDSKKKNYRTGDEIRSKNSRSNVFEVGKSRKSNFEFNLITKIVLFNIFVLGARGVIDPSGPSNISKNLPIKNSDSNKIKEKINNSAGKGLFSPVNKSDKTLAINAKGKLVPIACTKEEQKEQCKLDLIENNKIQRSYFSFNQDSQRIQQNRENQENHMQEFKDLMNEKAHPIFQVLNKDEEMKFRKLRYFFYCLAEYDSLSQMVKQQGSETCAGAEAKTVIDLIRLKLKNKIDFKIHSIHFKNELISDYIKDHVFLLVNSNIQEDRVILKSKKEVLSFFSTVKAENQIISENALIYDIWNNVRGEEFIKNTDGIYFNENFPWEMAKIEEVVSIKDSHIKEFAEHLQESIQEYFCDLLKKLGLTIDPIGTCKQRVGTFIEEKNIMSAENNKDDIEIVDNQGKNYKPK